MKTFLNSFFRPIDFNNPQQCFWDIVQVMAISMVVCALIVITAAWPVILNPPKIKPIPYAPYYSAKEYQRLINKHGRDRKVIQEAAQVPYYYNADGRKCKLI